MRRRRRAAAAIPCAGVAGLVALLFGCKQGPDFFSPLLPAEQAYTAPGDDIPPTEGAKGKRGAAQRQSGGMPPWVA